MKENIENKQPAIVASLRDIALQPTRKTNFSLQFCTRQTTEASKEVFDDKSFIEKPNELFSQAKRNTAQLGIYEPIKFRRIKIQENLIDSIGWKFSKRYGGNHK